MQTAAAAAAAVDDDNDDDVFVDAVGSHPLMFSSRYNQSVTNVFNMPRKPGKNSQAV